MQKPNPPAEKSSVGTDSSNTKIKDDSERMDASMVEEGSAEDSVEENSSCIRSENQESDQSPRKAQSAVTETVSDEPDSKEEE